ncbi:UNVERIFIED_CONTAM: hypothetical protein GTU68_021218, partial [Idotea baltica]|nr:hypothetical protein [Idotea baltica]
FNPSATEPTHLYQIWLRPAEKGIAPSYEQQAFPDEELKNQLRLVASPDAKEDCLTIHQDANIFIAKLSQGESVSHELSEEKHAWLQVLRGSVKLNDIQLDTSDGAAVSEETSMNIVATENAEVMLFDLA